MGNNQNIPTLHPQSRPEDTTSGGCCSLAEALHTTAPQPLTRTVSANRTRNNRHQDGWSTGSEHQPLRKQTTGPSAAAGASHSWPRPIGCRSTEQFRQASLSVFSSLRYQDRSSGGSTAAACVQLRARPEMTVATTGPFIQIGTVFPRAWIGPAAFDRRRIGCSATPPGVEPQGGHPTNQTSHGCMMKPIEAASSGIPQPKQPSLTSELSMNE